MKSDSTNRKSSNTSKHSKFKDLLPPKQKHNISKFTDVTPQANQAATQDNATYGSLIDLLSVSPTAGDNPITVTDKLSDFGIMFIKYSFLVIILTINFLGLSASLNCNADQELSKRIVSAIFAFFFGFVYLLINYYTYKVMHQGKICKFNKDKLFPFKA